MNTTSELCSEVDSRMACEFQAAEAEVINVERPSFAATHLLTIVWAGLISMTLLSAFIAEKAEPTAIIISIIGITIAVKGALVIDHLMGLKSMSPRIRWMMMSYFIIMPPIITFTVMFPDVVARITTL